MSHMSELALCLDDLRAAAHALLSAVEAMTTALSTPEAAPEPASSPPTTAAETPVTITKEDLRAELAAKSAAGYGAAVRALLQRYGAKQLSAVDPADYPELMMEARCIGSEVTDNG